MSSETFPTETKIVIEWANEDKKYRKQIIAPHSLIQSQSRFQLEMDFCQEMAHSLPIGSPLPLNTEHQA